MRTFLHDVWGCARGPIKGLAPHTRLLAGASTFAACMVAPATTAQGSLVTIAVALAWLTACRPPVRVVRTSVVLGLILFLPYFLLLPLLSTAPAVATGSFRPALIVPWTVLLRGMCGMLVSIATVGSLSASDLREAMVRLPVPNVVSAILLQIVHQSATLFYETKRVAAAMAVRGVTSGGATAWRVLASLPRVWLPRIVVRAERVAAAMALRGYCDGGLRSFRRVKTGLADGAVLALAIGVLALSITLRIWVSA